MVHDDEVIRSLYHKIKGAFLMNKDLEYFNKIEEMFNDVDFYNEEIDILFHYMSCHINNNSCECLFLDEYEYICGGDRSHNSIINRINELYKNYKSL